MEYHGQFPRSLFLVAAAGLLIAACNQGTSPGKRSPTAVQGILDLSDWNLEEDGIVHCDGEWEFYWKQPSNWVCHEIFFISNFQKAGELINTMYDVAAEAGYTTLNMGVYVQPVVQGVNYHVEFDLFCDPENLFEVERIKNLSVGAVKKLMDKGAFFSRPYGESTGIVMNRDAATVAALKKVKSILDPDNIMNPGKLCF